MTWGTSGNTVTLKYSNGDVCSTDTSKRHETTIYFGCAASGQVREKQLQYANTIAQLEFCFFVLHNEGTNAILLNIASIDCTVACDLSQHQHGYRTQSAVCIRR